MAISAGTTIMEQGSVTNKFYVVNEGNALIQRDGVVLGEQATGERFTGVEGKVLSREVEVE